MKIFNLIEDLLAYGLKERLLYKEDVYVVRNEIWQFLGIKGETIVPSQAIDFDIYALLNALTEEAKTLEFSLEYLYEIEQFQAKVMSLLMPRNSEVNRVFNQLKDQNPRFATDYFYHLSNASTYIRMDRVSKNMSWEVPSDYGTLDITINLSKPEKDPKEIALAKSVASSQYPKCLLCVENAGFSGTVTHPARYNHRIVNLELDKEDWYLQYSPYVYYNEHAIVLCHDHRDMKITKETFKRLSDFVDILPHYFLGSNADLHTVGGSILTHDHYQGGNYEMPMMRAKTVLTHQSDKYPSTRIEIIEWPLSVLKLVGHNKNEIIECGAHILESFIDYSDESVGLIAHTDERHNTITPIMRKTEEGYELFLALRNNRKDDNHPEGIFHPHREHHHIKKENIGLIEVMGLAVLPARLKDEMAEMKAYLSGNKAEVSESLAIHIPWLETLKDLPSDPNALDAYIKQQIGLKFENVLKDAGIFKNEYGKIKTFLLEGAQL